MKEFYETLTCTSRLSKWNVPRNSSSDPPPIDSIVIKNITFCDQPQAEIHPKINKYDPRASFNRDVDENSLGILKNKLQSCLIEGNLLLCHDLPSTCVEGEPQDIYCEEVPFDGTDNFETTDDIQESSLTCMTFMTFPKLASRKWWIFMWTACQLLLLRYQRLRKILEVKCLLNIGGIIEKKG